MNGTNGLNVDRSRLGTIIVVLGMLAAFAPMATDMYLPGFHRMSASFGVAEGDIELTLSAFFLGLAVGQAIYGPLIDRFGRKGPLLVGIGIYVLATVGCLLVPDIKLFTALRFVQAVGGSAGMLVGRAVIQDLLDPREGARALSLMMVVMTLAPIVAPVLGGFVITHAGWHAVFGIMLAFGLLCGGLVWFLVPETLPVHARKAVGLIETARIWKGLMSRRDFAVPAIAGGLAQASMFAFITGSPFVFINLHHVSAQTYGWLFALVACALIVSAQINRAALVRRSPETLLGAALVLNVVAGAITVGMGSTASLVALLVPLWFTIGSLGFIGANSAALAMAASGSHAGNGSSLVGVLQFGFAFAASSLVAASQNGTAYPMTLAILSCGVIASSLWFAKGRARDSRAAR